VPTYLDLVKVVKDLRSLLVSLRQRNNLLFGYLMKSGICKETVFPKTDDRLSNPETRHPKRPAWWENKNDK
jgi:hypothetical protein